MRNHDVTEARLSRLRATLERRRTQLKRRVAAERQAETEGHPDLTSGGHDRGDEAQADMQNDVSQALQTRERSEIQEIDAALARMDAGNYGICMDCSAEVGARRLDAYPAARRCRTCEEKHEHRGEGGHVPGP